MNLYKRMGFTAIYLPEETYDTLVPELTSRGKLPHAVPVNGTAKAVRGRRSQRRG
jgi:hypothetical protein|tara:strand:- start:1210 stop:1374 length:165 start_codon:yes stop_codon:yes gene_type:complete